jgi:YfiH family protein
MIVPNWPAPKNIQAFTTTRDNGFSVAPYDSFNLAMHVEDNPEHVAKNRKQFIEKNKLPAMPVWLNQTHSIIAVELTATTPTDKTINADASFTHASNTPCTAMTADCLPILVCNEKGDEVAAIHAGWRGLCDGVIESTIEKLTSPRDTLLVWLGPAIGPEVFELNNDIRLDFLTHNTQNSLAFKQVGSSWFADLYHLARISLAKLGVEKVYGGNYCTFTDKKQFFSYRRDGLTGRMASTIWFT